MKITGRLTEVGTFRENTFKIATDTGAYTCRCIDPDRDWDKLYDYLGCANISVDVYAKIDNKNETIYIVAI